MNEIILFRPSTNTVTNPKKHTHCKHNTEFPAPSLMGQWSDHRAVRYAGRNQIQTNILLFPHFLAHYHRVVLC